MAWNSWDIAWGILTGGVHTFIKAGIESYNAAKEAQNAVDELKKFQNKTKDEIVNVPTLKGAKNQLATGKTQPYVLGTHLFTPLILNSGKNSSKGYHVISGENGEHEFYNVVLEGGFNNQVLRKIYTDDITLAELTPADGKPQECNSESDLIHFAKNSVFASNDSYLEISQDGKSFVSEEFNEKCVEQVVADQIEKAKEKDGTSNENYKDMFYTLEPNTKSADVCIMFNGLLSYTSEGTKGNGKRTIIPSYSFDYAEIVATGGDASTAHWTDFTFTKYKKIPTQYERHTGLYQVTSNAYDTKGKVEKAIKEFDIYNRYKLFTGKTWIFLEGEDVNHSGESLTLSEMLETDIKEVNSKFYIVCKFRAFYDKVVKEELIPEYELTTFEGQFSKQIRFNAHVDFTYEDVKDLKYPITIKVSSPDQKPSSGSTTDDCYVQYIHSWTYDELKSKKENAFVPEKNIESKEAALSTLLGLHIEATKANEDKLNSIQVVTSGIARTWNSSEWSIDKSITSNPASWLIEVLTSEKHPASMMNEDEINLASLGAWYDFCESHGLMVNYVITDGMQKSAILELLCNCGHASLYQDNNGKLAIAIDEVKSEDAEVPLLNEQNLVSFSYDKSLERPVDGVIVDFLDAENDYQQNSFILMYERYREIDGETVDLWENPELRPHDSVLKKIAMDGITNQEQAKRHALYVMKCDKLRPKSCNAQVGLEGHFYKPLDLFRVQHPSLKIGLGNAEIKSVITEDGYITGLELYDAVTLNEFDTFNVVIQCIGNDYCVTIAREIKGFDGRTKEIEFKTPIPAINKVVPHPGDILSYGHEVETVADLMLIQNIARNGRTGFTLKLVDYDSRIVDDSEEIPVYIPTLTVPGNPAGSIPETLPSPTMAEVAEQIQNAVDDISITESPNIYAEVMSGGFSVNDDGVTPIAQHIKTTVHVIQENQEIDFYFDDFHLPEGFSVDVNDHTLTFSVKEGVRVTDGIFEIPIVYREYLHNAFYADENGVVYSDEEDNSYGALDFVDDTKVYKLGFHYQGVKGGAYLGPFDDLSKLPENVVIGDYFTYSGEDTEEYKKSGTYAWDGLKWSPDPIANHLGKALSDVLAIANDDLEKNNSTAYQFLDHLTANSIFVDRLVANTAFIEKLIAKDIYADKFQSIGEKAEEANSTAEEANKALYKNFVQCKFNHQNGSIIFVDIIKDDWTPPTEKGVVFYIDCHGVEISSLQHNYIYLYKDGISISVAAYDITTIKPINDSLMKVTLLGTKHQISATTYAYDVEVEPCADDILTLSGITDFYKDYGSTIIEGGYIQTNLIKVEELFAKNIKATGSIRVGERYKEDGTDNDVNAPGAYMGNDGVLKAKDAVIDSAKFDSCESEHQTMNNTNMNITSCTGLRFNNYQFHVYTGNEIIDFLKKTYNPTTTNGIAFLNGFIWFSSYVITVFGTYHEPKDESGDYIIKGCCSQGNVEIRISESTLKIYLYKFNQLEFTTICNIGLTESKLQGFLIG